MAKLYFTSKSLEFWDIFGMLIFILDQKCKLWRRSQGRHFQNWPKNLRFTNIWFEGIYDRICSLQFAYVCMCMWVCVWACECVCTLWSPQGWSAVGGVLGAAAASKLERRRPPEVCTAGTSAPQSCPRRGRWRRWWALWGGTGWDHDDQTAVLSRISKPCLLCSLFLAPLVNCKNRQSQVWPWESEYKTWFTILPLKIPVLRNWGSPSLTLYIHRRRMWLLLLDISLTWHRAWYERRNISYSRYLLRESLC